MKQQKDQKKRKSILLLTINAVSVLVLVAILALMGHAPKKEFKEQTMKVADKTWISFEDGVRHTYTFSKQGKMTHAHGHILIKGNWDWVSVNEMRISLKEQHHGTQQVVISEIDQVYYIRFKKIHEEELVLAEGLMETEFESGFNAYQSFSPLTGSEKINSTARLH